MGGQYGVVLEPWVATIRKAILGEAYLQADETPVLVLIRNLATQGSAPKEVLANIAEITDILKEVEQALKQEKPM